MDPCAKAMRGSRGWGAGSPEPPGKQQVLKVSIEKKQLAPTGK